MACLWTGLLQSLHVDHKLIHKRFLLNCQVNQGSVDQTCTPARNTAGECPLSALSVAPFESESKSLLCLSVFKHFSLLRFLTTTHGFLTWAAPLPIWVPPLMTHQIIRLRCKKPVNPNAGPDHQTAWWCPSGIPQVLLHARQKKTKKKKTLTKRFYPRRGSCLPEVLVTWFFR